jgi:hypothetical protein
MTWGPSIQFDKLRCLGATDSRGACVAFNVRISDQCPPSRPSGRQPKQWRRPGTHAAAIAHENRVDAWPSSPCLPASTHLVLGLCKAQDCQSKRRQINYAFYPIVYAIFVCRRVLSPLALLAVIAAVGDGRRGPKGPSYREHGGSPTRRERYGGRHPSATTDRLRCARRLSAFRVARSATSNFRMDESKIGMRSMLAHNKIPLPLCAGDAIL